MKFFKIAIILFCMVIISCSGSNFRKGEVFFAEGNYHSAIEMYHSFIRDNPGSGKVTEALFKMGDIAFQYIGDTNQGLEYFNALVKNYPVDEYTVLGQQRIAEIYKTKLNDCDRAIVEFQKLIDWQPSAKSASYYLYEIASCYMQIRNYPQALIEFESILKNYPDSPYAGDTIYQIGNIHYINSEYDDAVKYYRMVINDYKSSKYAPQAKFGLANSLEEKEEFDKALEIYKELLSEYPSRKVVEIRIAGVHERKKKLNR